MMLGNQMFLYSPKWYRVFIDELMFSEKQVVLMQIKIIIPELVASPMMWFCLSQKCNLPLRMLLKVKICFNRSIWALRFCISNKFPGDDVSAACQGPCSEKQRLDQHSPKLGFTKL